jgi:outer membrane receptor protein involved in Fe transport
MDIRVFPKYDDAEIIKVGNPELKAQFTNSFELGYRTVLQNGYVYSALYHRFINSAITRISTLAPNSDSHLIYATFHNAGASSNTGVEMVLAQTAAKWSSYNINANFYHNRIDAFTVKNIYPVKHTFTTAKQTIYSGNVKLNADFRFPKNVELQVVTVYLAPDVIPQGKIGQRFSLDLGVKKIVQNGKGEWFLNAVDLFNTMVIKQEIKGNGFNYTSDDYRETQVIRLGYGFKF